MNMNNFEECLECIESAKAILIFFLYADLLYSAWKKAK